MNLTIIILAGVAVCLTLLSASRYFSGGRRMTPAIKTWLRVAMIFFIVCIALLLL
jgi:hypothetical protein